MPSRICEEVFRALVEVCQADVSVNHSLLNASRRLRVYSLRFDTRVNVFVASLDFFLKSAHSPVLSFYRSHSRMLTEAYLIACVPSLAMAVASPHSAVYTTTVTKIQISIIVLLVGVCFLWTYHLEKLAYCVHK